MNRIVYTIRRTAHVVAASIAVELALDFGAGALAVILEPFLGEWVYFAAGVIVIGSLPVLGLKSLASRGESGSGICCSALVVDELGVDPASRRPRGNTAARTRTLGAQLSRPPGIRGCVPAHCVFDLLQLGGRSAEATTR